MTLYLDTSNVDIHTYFVLLQWFCVFSVPLFDVTLRRFAMPCSPLEVFEGVPFPNTTRPID